MHRQRTGAGRCAPPARLQRPAVPEIGRGNGRAVRRRRGGRARQHGGAGAALQPGIAPRHLLPAGIPGAQRRNPGQLDPQPGARGAGEAVGEGTARRRQDPWRLRGAAGPRTRRHRVDGIPRLLPDRGRLHQLGQAARDPGRAGPRLGRGFAGGVGAGHHRPRPAAVRPAVRALPQPGTRVDAGLRHRLLHGPPRRGHRLRRAQVRPRPRLPDHHLRHHGGEGGAARCRPRARLPVRLRRRTGQADPAAAGRPDDAGRRDRDRHAREEGTGPDRRRIQGALRGRGRRPRPRRPRPAAGGPDPQCRQARRRRGDRAQPAFGLLPAVRRTRWPWPRPQPGHPVRQGRRRVDRAGEVRLPRPAHADDHRLGGEGDQRAACARGPPATRHHRAGAHRQGDLRAVRARRFGGGVPVRIARHARTAEARQARHVRGHHRAGRAVPPRPAGQRDGQGMVRPQARHRRGQLSAPGAGTGAGADLWRDRVPGTGDADRPGAGRLFAGRRRPAAPRDGQEEARGNGEGTRQVRGRRRRARGGPAHGLADLRPDGEVRRVRLQQVALRGVRTGRPTRPRG